MTYRILAVSLYKHIISILIHVIVVGDCPLLTLSAWRGERAAVLKKSSIFREFGEISLSLVSDLNLKDFFFLKQSIA